MAPTAKRVLPPRSATGARSITITDAPCSRAASAADRPASPAPTTSTSGLVILTPRLVDGNLPVRTPSWLLLAVVRLPAGFFGRYATVGSSGVNRMPAGLRLALIIAMAITATGAAAADRIRLAVQKTGTLAWELDVIKTY